MLPAIGIAIVPKHRGVSVIEFDTMLETQDLKRDLELLAERLGKAQDYL